VAGGALACVIAMAMTVSGAPASGNFTFLAPAVFVGSQDLVTLELSPRSHFAVYGIEPPPEANLTLEADYAKITIIERTVQRIILEDGTHVAPPEDPEAEQTSQYIGAAKIKVRDWNAYHTVAWSVDSSAVVDTAGFELSGIANRPVLTSEHRSGDSPQPFQNTTFWPNAYNYAPYGSFYMFESSHTAASVAGSLFLYATGVVIDVTNEDGPFSILTGSRIHEDRVGPSGHRLVTFRTTAVLVHAEGALESTDLGPRLHIAASSAEAFNVREISLPAATGKLAVDNASVALPDRSHLDFLGDMTVIFPSQKSAPGQPISIGLNGSVETLELNRATSTSFGGGTEIAAGGVLLLAAFAAVVSFVRRGVTWVAYHSIRLKLVALWAAGTRISPADATKNAHRAALMDQLRSERMAPLHKVKQSGARLLGISESSVKKHLELLARAGDLGIVERSRRLYVGPNGGFLWDRKQQIALAFLSEPTGRAVVEAVCESPGADQSGIAVLASEILGSPVSRVAVRKYLEEL
jgi:hypothetical protein